MVIDTSALLAVLLDEPERDAFIALMADANDTLISAATLVEASIVMQAKTGHGGIVDLDELLAASGVRSIAVDGSQAHAARDAFARYGKGRAPAGLNFGDCFSYALAKTSNRPLLFKGSDFAQTDIAPARRIAPGG
jgi:ribonuclease VapC